ncbi:MAG: hypothetical protein WC852_04885 [Candidatus Nanoarchaeia archaeon]|jgi:predicted protein tyrosine phosphatase
MDIKIIGYRQAAKHKPSVPTLAIRIFDSYPDSDNSPKILLRDSSLYTICPYTFDDINLDTLLRDYPETDVFELRQKHIPFNENIAKQIITDFENNRKEKLELLVHCTLGASRSPAVAIALNEIFNLGNNTDKMKARYSAFNTYIYRLMLEAV